MVGFPAGGPLDQHARLLTDKLQAVLGQPVVVDYKAGAGGTVGAQDVMKAPPIRPHPTLANTGVMVINPALYSRLPYATLKDFTPIARTAMQPLALLVNPNVPSQEPAGIHGLRQSPSQGRSTMARQAMAASATWCPKCSRRPRACSWCTSPTAAAPLRSPT